MSLKSDLSADLKAHGYKNASWFHILKARFSHPSIRLLFNYRLAQKTNLRFLKRYLWLNTVSKTGCHISPQTVIEPGVIFPHATGIVIGNGAIIKTGSKIFQNVTLAIANDEENKTATIDEDALIYAGAVLIGDIKIGKSSTVGANALVKINVPDGQIAVGVPAVLK